MVRWIYKLFLWYNRMMYSIEEEENKMSDLKAIQARSLEMAEYFVAFCKEHGLLCYLCGGGAIGALRNKGFIPWDDDLDFFMPRKDYEKLAELWPCYADERYFLSKSDRDFVDRNLFITIRDKATTCIKPYQQDLDLPHGLALDVLPLDYFSKHQIFALIKKRISWKFSLNYKHVYEEVLR